MLQDKIDKLRRYIDRGLFVLDPEFQDPIQEIKLCQGEVGLISADSTYYLTLEGFLETEFTVYKEVFKIK